jgi:ribosomal protein S12 methylthiotransferase
LLNVGIVSLGCAKNLVDSEVMLGLLSTKGLTIVNEPEDAEVLIVNTCGFISSAKEESIDTILQMAEYKEKGKCKVLIVAGCLAQKYKSELLDQMPEVDAIIGTGDIEKLPEILEQALGGIKIAEVNTPDYLYSHENLRIQTTPSYSAYLKVADGCDNCCSYCIIPELRGSYRSRPMESILAEAKTLAEKGVKELMLIAQDTTRYGEELYGEFRLAKLIKELEKIDGIEWIRILYCYPTHFTDELIDTIAESKKVCKYLDIPLQHAADEILNSMNRRGNQAQVKELISKLKSKIPDIAIRTTFIVGFPGEKEENFTYLKNFIEEEKFDWVGVFTYSQEEGTPGAEMPNQVPEEIKEERYHQLMEMQQGISYQRNQHLVGKVFDVLVEGVSDQEGLVYRGRTFRDAPDIDGHVYFEGKDLLPGDFVKVKITESYDYDLMGEFVNESG